MAMGLKSSSGMGAGISPYDVDYLGGSNEDVRKDSIAVLLQKVDKIEALVHQIWNSLHAGKKDEGVQGVEEVYEVYVGGKATGITGSRSYCENLIVATAPTQTQPTQGIEPRRPYTGKL
jgi:hypothetical protein